MSEQPNPNFARGQLQEFTGDAIEIPPEKRRRGRHLRPVSSLPSWPWWLLTAAAVVAALIIGWLAGRA